MSAQIEPWIAATGDAEIIRPFGNEMKVLLPAAHTSGACSVLFAELRPGEGAPPHLHHDYDEYFFVVEKQARSIKCQSDHRQIAAGQGNR